MSDGVEDLIGEMMWIAFQHGVAIELTEITGRLVSKEGYERLKAYETAFEQLNLKFETK